MYTWYGLQGAMLQLIVAYVFDNLEEQFHTKEAVRRNCSKKAFPV